MKPCVGHTKNQLYKQRDAPSKVIVNLSNSKIIIYVSAGIIKKHTNADISTQPNQENISAQATMNKKNKIILCKPFM